MTHTASQAVIGSRSVAGRAVPALAALILGIGLLFAAGFAWPSALHNATHDTRHALGLPCH